MATLDVIGLGYVFVGSPIDYNAYTFFVNYKDGTRKQINQSDLRSLTPEPGSLATPELISGNADSDTAWVDSISDSQRDNYYSNVSSTGLYINCTATYEENGQILSKTFKIQVLEWECKYHMLVNSYVVLFQNAELQSTSMTRPSVRENHLYSVSRSYAIQSNAPLYLDISQASEIHVVPVQDPTTGGRKHNRTYRISADIYKVYSTNLKSPINDKSFTTKTELVDEIYSVPFTTTNHPLWGESQYMPPFDHSGASPTVSKGDGLHKSNASGFSVNYYSKNSTDTVLKSASMPFCDLNGTQGYNTGMYYWDYYEGIPGIVPSYRVMELDHDWHGLISIYQNNNPAFSSPEEWVEAVKKEVGK